MLKIHSLFGVSSSVGCARGYVLLAGVSPSANSFRHEHALSSGEFLACARRMAATLDAHPPPGREATGQRLTLAVKRRLAPQSHRHNAQSPSEDDTFAEKLCQAVKARLASRSRHKHTTAASSDDESFAQMLARITKARAKLRRA
jgi:hypothetical protein